MTLLWTILTTDLYKRVGGLGGDTTLVLLVADHLDVSLVAPGRSPGVLHEPVVLATVRAVPDRQHAVVQLGAAALRLVIHTWPPGE